MRPDERVKNALHTYGARGLPMVLESYFTLQARLSYQSLVTPIAINKAVEKFRKESESISDIDELVDFIYCFSYLGISARPFQMRTEILELCTMLKKRDAKSLLEIGTASGGTLFLFSKVAASDANIISINLPSGNLDAWCLKYRDMLYGAFATGGQKMHLLKANSHDAATLQNVNKKLAGAKLDFLFIDGDHSYDGVKKDFEMYSPLVKKGGLIGFHDISPSSMKNPVVDYWKELTKIYKYKEIEYSGGKGYGIGLVYW